MYENFLREYNFATKISPTLVGSLLHTYVVASNTTNHLLFTSHLFGTQCDLLN